MELINWFAGAIASAATLGIADAKARNIQPIEALWLALLWVTETLLAAMQFGRNWHIATLCGNAAFRSLLERSGHRLSRTHRTRFMSTQLRKSAGDEFTRRADSQESNFTLAAWALMISQAG